MDYYEFEDWFHTVLDTVQEKELQAISRKSHHDIEVKENVDEDDMAGGDAEPTSPYWEVLTEDPDDAEGMERYFRFDEVRSAAARGCFHATPRCGGDAVERVHFCPPNPNLRPRCRLRDAG